MKSRFVIIIMIGVVMASCSKSKHNTAVGTYKGTFQRQVNGAGAIAPVTITFFDQAWQGQSGVDKYPALCRGNQSITGDNINFDNACVWTAEFDWSIILQGDYKLTSNDGEHMEFSRDYANGTKDIYKLTKQ